MGNDKDNRNGMEDKRTVRRRVVTAVSNSFVLHFVKEKLLSKRNGRGRDVVGGG